MTRRYSRELLQRECERWVEKLRGLGHGLPDVPVIVYTSGREFDRAMGSTFVGRSRRQRGLLGQAAFSSAARPIVYVRLRKLPAGEDPLVTLIHELLHHAVPRRTHEEVYALSEKYRAEDEHSAIPYVPRTVESSEIDSSWPQWSDAKESYMRPRLNDWLDRLWLEANDFGPARDSRGRFVSRKHLAVRTSSGNPHKWGPLTNTRSELVPPLRPKYAGPLSLICNGIAATPGAYEESRASQKDQCGEGIADD